MSLQTLQQTGSTPQWQPPIRRPTSAGTLLSSQPINASTNTAMSADTIIVGGGNSNSVVVGWTSMQPAASPLWMSTDQSVQVYTTAWLGSPIPSSWRPISLTKSTVRECSASTAPLPLPVTSTPAQTLRSPLAQALDVVDAFAAREQNWDGFGGHAPNQGAVRDAKAFLQSLPVELLPDTLVSPGDGEIALQWRRGTLFLEVGFFGDGTMSWFVRGATGADHGDDAYDRENPRISEKLTLAFSAILETPLAMLFIARRGKAR